MRPRTLPLSFVPKPYGHAGTNFPKAARATTDIKVCTVEAISYVLGYATATTALPDFDPSILNFLMHWNDKSEEFRVRVAPYIPRLAALKGLWHEQKNASSVFSKAMSQQIPAKPIQAKAVVEGIVNFLDWAKQYRPMADPKKSATRVARSTKAAVALAKRKTTKAQKAEAIII